LQPVPAISAITTGTDPAFQRAYLEHYFRVDPHLQRVSALGPGKVLLSREVITDDELLATEYYNDYCRPQCLNDLQGAVLIRDSARFVTFATLSSRQRRFDDSTRARLDMLLPHLARAMALTLRGEELEPVNLALQPASAAGQCGLLRVSAELEVLAASSGVLDWLPQRQGALHVRDGLLTARADRDRETLQAGVRAALAGSRQAFALDPDAAERANLIVSPAEPCLTHPEPAALVFFTLQSSRSDAASSLRAAQEALPPALRRVSELLAVGASDKEIAAQLELPLTTARTYVFRVLRRLGVHSRRELMTRRS
jgi:DNA-directed RNA polymerase specialized sigma24 family protein